MLYPLPDHWDCCTNQLKETHRVAKTAVWCKNAVLYSSGFVTFEVGGFLFRCSIYGGPNFSQNVLHDSPEGNFAVYYGQAHPPELTIEAGRNVPKGFPTFPVHTRIDSFDNLSVTLPKAAGQLMREANGA